MGIVIEIQFGIVIEIHVCNDHIIKVYRLKLELKYMIELEWNISNYQIKFELGLKYNSEIIRLDPLP